MKNIERFTPLYVIAYAIMSSMENLQYMECEVQYNVLNKSLSLWQRPRNPYIAALQHFVLQLISKIIMYTMQNVIHLEIHPVALKVKNSGRSRNIEILSQFSGFKFFFNHKIFGACISGEILPPTYFKTSWWEALIISASLIARWSSQRIMFLSVDWCGVTEIGWASWSRTTKEHVASKPIPRTSDVLTLLQAFYLKIK